jgi:antitoxin VapB
MEANIIASESELHAKLDRMQELLGRAGLDALLLQRTSNFAWATCGASSYIDRADSMGVASLLITPTHRYVITNNIEANRLIQEEQLVEQGWEILASPWHEEDPLRAELTRGMRLGADFGYPGALDLSWEIAQVRSRLTVQEATRFRELASLCAEGMRQAALAVRPAMTEHEISGLLFKEIEGRGVQVIVSLVAVDERVFSYRHPLPTSKPLQQYAMLVLCGRKGGLICSLTRLVHFGPMSEELRRKTEAVAQIDARMIAATRPEATLSDIFRIGQSAYAGWGYPDEWEKHHQGGLAGYAPREIIARPTSPEPVLVGQAFAWNPSITGVKSEDTILVGEQTNEVLTEMKDWPGIAIPIGEQVIKRPAVLQR